MSQLKQVCDHEEEPLCMALGDWYVLEQSMRRVEGKVFNVINCNLRDYPELLLSLDRYKDWLSGGLERDYNKTAEYYLGRLEGMISLLGNAEVFTPPSYLGEYYLGEETVSGRNSKKVLLELVDGPKTYAALSDVKLEGMMVEGVVATSSDVVLQHILKQLFLAGLVDEKRDAAGRSYKLKLAGYEALFVQGE